MRLSILTEDGLQTEIPIHIHNAKNKQRIIRRDPYLVGVEAVHGLDQLPRLSAHALPEFDDVSEGEGVVGHVKVLKRVRGDNLHRDT